MTVVYIILAILLFGVLIVVHEGGHFTAAKLCGVKVNEFAVGMGPAIWKKTKGETQYSIRCIPIGGYCAMAGEDESSDDPRAFTSQPAWKRAIILVAGSFMNFVLGLVILLVLYSSAAAFIAPIVDGFMDGCPYEGEEGLMAGDRFISIDGRRIHEYYDVSECLDNGETVHDIVLRRNGEKLRLDGFRMERIDYDGSGTLYYGFYFGYEDATVLTVLRNVWDTAMEFCHWVWDGLSQLVNGEVGVEEMSGPVGIVDLMAETGEQAESTSDALYSIFYLGAFIAVNLAMMNMLPIPALDGGRVFCLIVTAIIEKITHKKLDPKYEAYIHAAGMVLLLAFMGFIMFNDIVKLIKK